MHKIFFKRAPALIQSRPETPKIEIVQQHAKTFTDTFDASRLSVIKKPCQSAHIMSRQHGHVIHMLYILFHIIIYMINIFYIAKTVRASLYKNSFDGTEKKKESFYLTTCIEIYYHIIC
jgi:hypothetical protein